MNKTDLINAVAEQADLTKKDANAAVDAVFESIQSSLSKGEKVQLIGFGNFEVRERAARKGRNPQTYQEEVGANAYEVDHDERRIPSIEIHSANPTS